MQADAQGRKFVAAPDGYKYMLVDTGATAPPAEPFLFVSIHVSDLAKSKKVRGGGEVHIPGVGRLIIPFHSLN